MIRIYFLLDIVWHNSGEKILTLQLEKLLLMNHFIPLHLILTIIIPGEDPRLKH